MSENERIFDLITKLYDEMKEIKSEVKDIKSEVKDIKSEVKDIQMTFENEVSKNIRIVAEGHINLDRKLDEALKVEKEKELLLIRVTSLENEVRRLKTQIERIS